MRNLFLLIVFAASGYLAYQNYRTTHFATDIVFRDVHGREHAFEPPCKPAVIVFWSNLPNRESGRALEVLDIVRSYYPEDKVDAIAIDLDRASEADIEAQGRHDGRRSTMAVPQTGDDATQLKALRRRFKVRDPGEDIWVIGSDASLHFVDASDPAPNAARLFALVDAFLRPAAKP
ncbi:MAG: hypothetical protein HY077_05635 [Elusimicrobia bacterium]|nr:hypothetical protein [Elusimicrobiota bacterium]